MRPRSRQIRYMNPTTTRGDENQSEKRMGEAAVMLESKDRAFETAEHVEIRRFGRQRHGRSGEGGLAVESGAGEAGSGQEVGDGFQVNFVTQSSGYVISGCAAEGVAGSCNFSPLATRPMARTIRRRGHAPLSSAKNISPMRVER